MSVLQSKVQNLDHAVQGALDDSRFQAAVKNVIFVPGVDAVEDVSDYDTHQ